MPDYDRRLADLERNMRAIPSRWAGGPPATATLIRIARGNKLAEYGTVPKIYGLKYTTGGNVTIPASALEGATTDPDITGTDETYPDGLCWGFIVGSTTPVFVANVALSPVQQDILSPLSIPEGSQVWCQRTVLVPKDGAPTVLVPVWLTWRV
jgi:hypothetical protein